MGKPRRTFPRQLKVEAVKRVTEQGRHFAEAAANLGIVTLNPAHFSWGAP